LATNNNKWKTNSTYKKYAIVAKERGLNCGVNEIFNNDGNTIRISGSWEAISKCNIHIKKIINGKEYLVRYDRTSLGTSLIFSIDQQPFYLGKTVNLQVDNFKELPDATTEEDSWENGNDKNVITFIDLSFYTDFVQQLIKGNYLIVKNNDYKIHVSLRGFSASYNELSPKYGCSY